MAVAQTVMAGATVAECAAKGFSKLTAGLRAAAVGAGGRWRGWSAWAEIVELTAGEAVASLSRSSCGSGNCERSGATVGSQGARKAPWRMALRWRWLGRRLIGLWLCDDGWVLEVGAVWLEVGQRR